nr:MAG TPA: hypothetical protein [Bacteriophage sp.]
MRYPPLSNGLMSHVCCHCWSVVRLSVVCPVVRAVSLLTLLS